MDWFRLLTFKSAKNPELAPHAYLAYLLFWTFLVGLFVLFDFPVIGNNFGFVVIGLILFGIATPTESAAFGVLGILVIAVALGDLTWQAIQKALKGTLEVTGMLLLVVIASSTFSQLLAFSGVTSGMVSLVNGLEWSPLTMVVLMFIILLFMGMFMEQVSIMMLTIPIFFPVASALGFDLVWFGIVMLLALEMSGITPPFGLNLFILLGVAPEGTSMKEVALSGLPFLLCGVLLFGLLVWFPSVALFLPSLMNN